MFQVQISELINILPLQLEEPETSYTISAYLVAKIV